jgi:site-specific recombinase XerD
MKHSFYLKDPQERTGSKPSLILFTCYFNKEKKKFVYSTGENISPIHWDFDNNVPKTRGSNKAGNAISIKNQLGRYSRKFEELLAIHQKIGETFTSKILRNGFDVEFKKSKQGHNSFFDAYDKFMESNQKKRTWKKATIKRYKNVKNHLLAFQDYKSLKLTFGLIHNEFYSDFSDFCYTVLDHSTNTFSRNIGLFKTFMHWAIDEQLTYNDKFKNFKKPERIATNPVALSLDQVQELFNHEFEAKYLERVRDVFVFQCLTGLRYGELKLISKRNIKENLLLIKEEKDISKPQREIPLFEISNFILKKYDYKLPLLSNQKQNKYVKIAFELAGFNSEVELHRNKNAHSELLIQPFYKLIQTHTARRTFITIMKKKGVADKTIMKMTGHKDLKTFNTYYQVDTEAKQDAIKMAFGSLELTACKV